MPTTYISNAGVDTVVGGSDGTGNCFPIPLTANGAGIKVDATATTQPVSLATVPTHPVTNAGTFAVQAALNAETTKVIGTVNVAAGQSVAVTQATGTSLHAVLDATSTTAVTQATAANLLCTASIAAAQTLATVTTVSACRVVGSTGATLDAAIGGVAPTNARWHTNAPATASAAAMATPITTAALTVVNIKASAGNVYGFSINNASAAVIFLQFYNTAGTPTLGTSVIFSVACPIGVTNFQPGTHAMANFATGIGIGASTTATSTGTPTVAPSVTIFFK